MADSNSEVLDSVVENYCFNNCNLYILLEYDNNFLVFRVCKDEQLQYPRSWGTSFLSAGVYMTVGKIQHCKNASAPKLWVDIFLSCTNAVMTFLLSPSEKDSVVTMLRLFFHDKFPIVEGACCVYFPPSVFFLFSVAICGLSFFSWSMLRPFLPDRGPVTFCVLCPCEAWIWCHEAHPSTILHQCLFL